ncbi:hypothetical protein AB0283_19370 [Micromonospora vinacea]|uniref:hypothetical protein n=1 Tax=Micromonospora vinacea TaxID=709878 RepID=UPI00344C9092
MPIEAHLQMIQTIISRLASQSTTIKGWAVTLTALLLGFSAGTTEPAVVGIAIYVIMAFAILDAYYLSLERAYRNLYKLACEERVGAWVLAVPGPTFKEIVRAFFSPAVALVYGSSLLAATGMGLLLGGLL